MDADGKDGVTRQQNMVTGLWNTCKHGTRGLNVREGSPRQEIMVKKMIIKSWSVYDRCTLFGRSVYILLLRLASLGATPRSFSGLRRRSGLGLSSDDWALGHVGRTRRSGTTVDSGVRTLIGVDFANGWTIGNKLLMHKSVGNRSISTWGVEVWSVRRETTDSRLRSSSVSWRFGRGA